MKAIALNCSGLKCDTLGCSWEDESISFDDYQAWLNRPCPECGGNLLTQKDYDLIKNMVDFTEIINTFAGEIPDNSEMFTVRITTDGKGIPAFGKVEKLEVKE